MTELEPPAYPGLADELARARAALVPELVTVETCQRVVRMLRDKSVVDPAMVIRCLEFLLQEAKP